ncbi:hypothetical protein T09_13357 [Trichinella sp. T9]|nr:hypothetical protein T09_13357 [Trichinella sp. T9]
MFLKFIVEYSCIPYYSHIIENAALVFTVTH